MKLIIYCTESEAQAIRDAIQDKFHNLKHSPSERGQKIASSLEWLSKRLSHALRLTTGEDDTITVRI